MLQAESEKLRQAWIQAVQASIASAYKDIADNYYIEVHAAPVTPTLLHSYSESPPLTCPSIFTLSAAVGPDCLALHQQH